MSLRTLLQKISSETPQCTLATVVESSRKDQVGQALLCKDGKIIAGTIGGGANEHQLLQQASTLASPWSLVHIGHSLPGMQTDACSNPMTVLLEQIQTDSQTGSFYRQVQIRFKQSKPQMHLCLFAEDMPPHHFFGSHQKPELCSPDHSEFTALVQKQWPSLFLKSVPTSGILDIEDRQVRFFSQACNRDGRVICFGAGHVAQELCPLLARLGFTVVIVDPRPELCNHELFPEADQLVASSSLSFFESSPIDELDRLIIMSPSHATDFTILEQSAGTRASYIGLLGGRKKIDSFRNSLEQKGLWGKLQPRLHAPVGIDIGSRSPLEVAVSIAAQLVALRNCQ